MRQVLGIPRGFTLIELIMVIMILGVLAIFAAPRMFNSGDFYARGFHDETLSLLRYAQKAAIAQRRTVCVTFTNTSVSLAMANNASATDCSSPENAFTGPNGVPTVTARTGVSYNGTPTNFNFDSLGQPVGMVTQNIKINGTSDVVVEAVTGYVHD